MSKKQTSLDLAYSPHALNYVMYLHTDFRLSGPVRMCCPQVFNKDDQFDLNASEWGKAHLELKDNIKNIVNAHNLDDNDLERQLELLNITDPWSLRGFFAKGKGLGYIHLAKAICNDHNGYLMDNITGTEGNEMICFIKAINEVAFVEEYLSHHNKSKPKIVRIVISSQVPKNTISVHPYRSNDFKYIPSYYRGDKGVIRLPAIIDFSEKKRDIRVYRDPSNVKIPTREEILKTAQDIIGKDNVHDVEQIS